MSLSLPIPLCYHCTKVVGKAGGYSERYQTLHFCNYRVDWNRAMIRVHHVDRIPPFQSSFSLPYAT